MRLTIACEGTPTLTCDWQEFRRDHGEAVRPEHMDKILCQLAKGQTVRMFASSGAEIEVRAQPEPARGRT